MSRIDENQKNNFLRNSSSHTENEYIKIRLFDSKLNLKKNGEERKLLVKLNLVQFFKMNNFFESAMMEKLRVKKMINL